MAETTEFTSTKTTGCTSCGTGSCNRLNVYDWLYDMQLPPGIKPCEVVEVRFKGSRKEFFRNINNLPLKVGDVVAVEGSPGHDIGTVSITGELVRLQLKKKNIDEKSPDIKGLYRIAKGGDLEKWNQVKDLESPMMHETRTIALGLKLNMKLTDVEFQGDGKKATFFYTAEDRVDFRELIKVMADKFKIRVEMRQIGARQEAARLGGIGSCGRELCCSSWLTDFKVVTTSAARYQNLSINQAKLAGQCGKLKCCLNYELDSYMDAIKGLPDSGIKLVTQKGKAHHIKTDIFKRLMWYAYDAERNENNEVQYNVSEKWIPLTADRVKEIIDLNKEDKKPDDLVAFSSVVVAKPIDFTDVVGQDSISRMDKKKKKKFKKPNRKPDGVQVGDKDVKDKEIRDKGIKNKEMRDIGIRDKDVSDKDISDKGIRDKGIKDKEMRDKLQKDREKKDKEIRERNARIKDSRDKETGK